MASPDPTNDEPQSPDPPGWGVNYDPHNDTPNGWSAIVGTYRARTMHGQDPEKNPELFTPRVNFKWPTHEEAMLTANAAVEPKKKKMKLKLPDHSSAEDVTPQTMHAACIKPAETAINTEKAADGVAPFVLED